MIELIITALVIFIMARTVTISGLGIDDWRNRRKLSFKKWSKISKQITAGLMVILFAFELTDVFWGTTKVVDGLILFLFLVVFNTVICAVVGTVLKAALTLPYQAITWLVFTALIVWIIKTLNGHVWQVYLPFTGYFAWLIWLKFYRQQAKKSAELTKNIA